ncbi:MAG: DEAD/DEAH box helicase, partial [Promethearchaeota archaeon]
MIQAELTQYGLTPQIITCIQNTGITQLHEDQLSALKKGLLRNRSFLVSTPSGSGKTLIAEIAAIHTILTHHGKSLFLVPLRALAYEKFTYFQKVYSSLGVHVRIAVGDQELSKNELEKADLLIMTYEKFDAYLRSCRDFDWIYSIQTVIIDEIHVLGERGRGPRLENLIIRIYRLPEPPQLITLSATIANPKNILQWFDYLEKKYRSQSFQSVLNSVRPIELHHSIVKTHNKIQKIAEICKKVLQNKGKVLVFTNTRRDTELVSEELASALFSHHDHLSRDEVLMKIKEKGRNPDSISPDLIDRLVYKVAYHHAGLNTNERTLLEEFFRSDLLNILCCTNTLSAGINTPAQAVILKEYQVYVPNPVHSSKTPQFKKFVKQPIDKNLFHQICGRAGRPGFDETGLVFIIVPDAENKGWVEDYYFDRDNNGKLQPQFNNLTSTFSLNPVLLQEIVLLKIFETKQFHMGKFIDFIQDSLLWHQIAQKDFPLEAYFNLQPLNFTILLKTFGQKLHFLIQKLVKTRIQITKFIPNQKI